MRTPDRAFVRELRAMDKRMDVWWSDRWKKWMIISTFLPNGEKISKPVAGLTEYDPIQGRLFVIQWVLEENGVPLELTPRVIQALWVLKQGREVRLDRALRAVDEEELKRMRRHDAEGDLSRKDFTKMVHRIDTSRTFS